MESNIDELCRKLNDERIKRLLEGLQGLEEIRFKDKHTDNQVQNVNKEKMATASYSEVLSSQPPNTNNPDQTSNDNENTEIPQRIPSENVKPIFMKDTDFFGSVKPPKTLWITNVEIYKAIGAKVPANCIKGIQRVREMWRIYMDNEEDKLSLLYQGLHLRGRHVPLHSQNPHNPGRLQPDTIRIKVKNVPISADDGQIERALTVHGCDIQGIFRERLRIDGKLTNCETGDRVIISKLLKEPIPRHIQIGKYMAAVFHAGQPEFQDKRQSDSKERLCHKCFESDHIIQNCPNDWVCKSCHKSGHKMIDCDAKMQQEQEQEGEKQTLNETTTSETVAASQETQTQSAQSNNKADNEQTATQKGSEKPENRNRRGKGQNNVDKNQQSLEMFMGTPLANNRRRPDYNHTPPTPPDILRDKTEGGRKKQKPAEKKTTNNK